MDLSADAALLALISDVVGLLDLDELREALCIALDRGAPSDFVSINEIGPDPADMHSVVRPELPQHMHDLWARYGHQNPLIERFARTRDTRPYRFSDVVSRSELHALGLYQEFYAELGLEYQIAFVIQVSPPRYVAVALSRRERDFSDAERTLLDRFRPYLIQTYRAAISHTALRSALEARETPVPRADRLVGSGLTTREAEVLCRVARGQTNTDIANALGVSERTIGKHLQRCYRKLNARNRSHAASIAWELAQPRTTRA